MIEGTIRFVSYKAAADPIEMSRLEYRAIVGGSFESMFQQYVPTTLLSLLCF